MKSKYTESDLQYALNDINNGVSARKASLKWGVPRSTLQGRTYGQLSHLEAAEPSQKLSRVQEERLTGWVLVQESLGLSPTRSEEHTSELQSHSALVCRLLLEKK